MAKVKVVRVLFIDVESGACFAMTESPIELLPESFATQTTVSIEDQDWDVVSAEPVTRAECESTGQLNLTLRKVNPAGNVSPDEIRYSLPTICDAIPDVAAGTSKRGRRVLELHEDDWRQVEFVSRSCQDEIEQGLANIFQIYRDQQGEGGAFRELHVRKEVAEPLRDARLTLGRAQDQFGPPAPPLEGLAYRREDGLIEGGFAFKGRSGLQFYGRERDGRLVALGLLFNGSHGPVDQDGHAVAALMRGHDLCLVDWCALRQVQAAEAEVVAYLKSRAHR
jgi:hypothetical protein